MFFNYEYLYATLKGSSAVTILDELEVFLKADRQLRRDAAMKTLFANLAMIRPYITRFPESLAYELAGLWRWKLFLWLCIGVRTHSHTRTRSEDQTLQHAVLVSPVSSFRPWQVDSPSSSASHR